MKNLLEVKIFIFVTTKTTSKLTSEPRRLKLAEGAYSKIIDHYNKSDEVKARAGKIEKECEVNHPSLDKNVRDPFYSLRKTCLKDCQLEFTVVINLSIR